jgi:photosynthetic reaction center H subunit
MGTGAITQYVDVAQLVLYAFWIFFFGLCYYLVREGHREGYPMETESGRGVIAGWPVPGSSKTYVLHNGNEMVVPHEPEVKQTLLAEPTHGWIGAPLQPTGANPMLDGVGPGAWADRQDVPDATSHGHPRLQPLRMAHEFSVNAKNIDPRGLPVVGGDGVVGGTVSDLWIDHSESQFRYLEVKLPDGSRSVMLPINFARIKSDKVQVRSIYGHQFAHVPGLKRDDQITFLEEEKVMAYYGAGTLYADPSRAETLI